MIDSVEIYLLLRTYIVAVAPAILIMVLAAIWLLITDERKHR